MHNAPDWRDRARQTLARHRAVVAARGAILRERGETRQQLFWRIDTCQRHVAEIEASVTRYPDGASHQRALTTARTALDVATRELSDFDAATAASMPPLDEALAGRLEDAARRLELESGVQTGVFIR